VALALRDKRKARLLISPRIVALDERRAASRTAPTLPVRELQALQDQLSLAVRDVFPAQRKLVRA